MRLMKHQRTVVRWGRNKRSIALWIAMRLGKTLIAKRWMERRPGAKRILVVAPLSALPSWRKQLIEDGVNPAEICHLTGTARQRERALEKGLNAKWFLINYRGLTKSGFKTKSGKPRAVPSDYALLEWDGVILDESTRVRSPRSQITKVALSTLADAPYKACLSGLPNPEGPKDFVCQMLFLFGEFMGCRNFWEWRTRWMRPVGHDWTVTGEALSIIRQTVKENSFILSKKDAGLGTKLIRETRHVQLPAKVMREMRRAQSELEIDAGGGMLTNNVLTALTWTAQLCGGRFPHDKSLHHQAKVNELIELAKGELKGEPLIVAAAYTAEIMAAAEALKKAKISCLTITGKTTKINPQFVSDFQKGQVQVLCVQPKCLQMGADLSRSSTMIHLSRWWDYEINAQFDERTEHPKRTDPRLCIDIVAEDTIDEDKVLALTEKGATARTFTRRFLELVKQRKEAS